MREQLALLPEYLSAHVRLTLAALLAGTLLAVPTGVLAVRAPRLQRWLLGGASVIQTVPALALLAVMVPLLSGLGLPGIGILPAFLALVLYSLLPILRNTVAALEGIDPAVREAAQAVGLTPRQQLRQVELPLALPVIVAGIRTAAVWTVGMATLATPVGATSLGNYIFAGLQTRNSSAVLVGCAASAILALVLDGLVRAAATGLHRRRPRLVQGAGAALLALATLAVLGAPSLRPAAVRPVRIGAKPFTESVILAHVLGRQVGRATGRPVAILPSLGSTVAFDALSRDEIDLYVDYTGTLWATVMGRTGSRPPRSALREETRAWLAERHGITLAAGLGFENAYVFALRRADAERLGLRRVGDLAPHAPDLALASDYEFFSREEWRAVRDAYGLSFREQRTLDAALLYEAVAHRQVDVITAYSSDGRIATLDLATLEDDRGALPPYDAVILAAPRLRDEAPDVLAAVASLEGAIDVRLMRALNRAVDADGETPAQAATRFTLPPR